MYCSDVVFCIYLGPSCSAFGVCDDEYVVRSDLEVVVDVRCHFPECRRQQNVSRTGDNQILKLKINCWRLEEDLFCYFINEGFIPRGKLHFKTSFISYKHIFRVIYDSTCLGGTKFAANHLFTHVLNSYYSMFKDYWNCISTYVVFIVRIPLYFTFHSLKTYLMKQFTNQYSAPGFDFTIFT